MKTIDPKLIGVKLKTVSVQPIGLQHELTNEGFVLTIDAVTTGLQLQKIRLACPEWWAGVIGDEIHQVLDERQARLERLRRSTSG